MGEKSRRDSRLEAIDISHIRKPGSLPKGAVAQAIHLASTFDMNEEMALMETTISAKDLNASYKDIYNTTSVIAGLIIAFSFSATFTRLVPADGLETIWGASTRSTIVDIYGLLIGISLVASFSAILYSTFMTTMLAQIPAEATTRFFQLTGSVRIQIVFLFQQIMLAGFLLSTLAQISLNYPPWVTITIVVLLLFVVIAAIIAQAGIQATRFEVLREDYVKYETQQNKQEAADAKIGSSF